MDVYVILIQLTNKIEKIKIKSLFGITMAKFICFPAAPVQPKSHDSKAIIAQPKERDLEKLASEASKLIEDYQSFLTRSNMK